MSPAMGCVLTKQMYDLITVSNDKTTNIFKKEWLANTKKNIKKNYQKGWLLIDSCRNIAHNKAVICIGAGPSLKNNKDLIKELCLLNANFPFEQQPFFFIVSNHQFKPCLDYGIVPHMVIWVDASDNIRDQICKDIPRIAQNVFLIASTHCHPGVIGEWISQGRHVRYLLTQDKEEAKAYEKYSGEKSEGKGLLMGGNVMNCAYMATLHCLDGRIFIATGNDLSFDIHEDADIRRSGYYEDQDYSTNINRRDEAKEQFKWMGFKFIGTQFQNVIPQVVLTPKATVPNLFTYKKWIESQVAMQDAQSKGVSFHYYNCSESGIVGVLCKSDDPTNLENKANWFLMDEVVPNHWHTRTLLDATNQYLSAREALLWQNKARAQGRAGGLVKSVSPQGVSLLQ